MRRTLQRAAAVGVPIVVLGAGLVAGSAGAAISTATFCANVRQDSSGFSDIGGVAAEQRADIECLAASGVTTGTSATTYTPTGDVFRDSMAAFVARLVDTANALEARTLAALPSDVADAFTDDEGSVHEGQINRLAAAGIVNGKTAETYGPNGAGNEVTRAQMASFLVRAIDYLRPGDLAAGADAFTDDEGNEHEDNINKLAAIDIVDGVGSGAYAPNADVSRAQMASFLVRTFAYLHQQGDIAALPPTAQSIVVTPSSATTNGTDTAPGDEVAVVGTRIDANSVDVALFPCGVTSSAQGVITFADANADNGADRDAAQVDAEIVSVNGAATPATDTEHVSDATVADGRVTVAVDSSLRDCVVVVVWDDADDDDVLDLDANDRPTENFGVSGSITFVRPPAASGPMDENVESVDAASDSFTGCEVGGAVPGAGDVPGEGTPLNPVSTTECFTFRYDGDDVFTIGDAPSSLAAFEAALSVGDDVTGTYDSTPGGQSRFDLTDEATTPDTTVPRALDTELTIQTSEALLDTGDVVQICFDDSMADPADGNPLAPDVESLRVRDSDGTEATVTNGTNATFRLGTQAVSPIAVSSPEVATCPPNRVIEVVLSASPTVNVVGATAGVGVPATILVASQIENTAGLEFTADSGSPDLLIDQEVTAEPS